jgi:hypothetical protein
MARLPGFVAQAVLGFILDWRTSRLFLEVGRHAAALDHEAGNYAMKNRAIEETVLRILEEVLHGLGRLVLIQLNRQRALRCLDFKLRVGGL